MSVTIREQSDQMKAAAAEHLPAEVLVAVFDRSPPLSGRPRRPAVTRRSWPADHAGRRPDRPATPPKR